METYFWYIKNPDDSHLKNTTMRHTIKNTILHTSGVEKRIDDRNSIVKLIVGSVLLGLQVWWVVFMILNIENRWPFVSTLVTFISIFAALAVYCRRMNSAARIAWMIVIAALPILGLCLYLLMGRQSLTKKKRRLFGEIQSVMRTHVRQDESVMRSLEEEGLREAAIFRYVESETGLPVYRNTDIRYFGETTDALQEMLAQLRLAESFIFLEYYAIEDLESFAPVKKILSEKAAAGVEVRLLYDEIGSVGFLTQSFITRMEALGIKCRVFNPMVPFVNIFMNNRDHRKIVVIDGKVGFTGGFNLANEYFHVTQPYGYWKDSGLMLTGEAVRSLTILFLEMWGATGGYAENPERFLPVIPYEPEEKIYVQPYDGTPMRYERVAEEVYMNILRAAERYVWFSSPYLVITDEFSRELTSAAKRGVDVRIIVPGIPDKKTVYLETQSFFPQLIRAGVRIFIYQPGFCHAKMCVSDDRFSIVGTINLDYRSLYHHFENAVLMKGETVSGEIRDDFLAMFGECREVSAGDAEARMPWQIVQAFLRLIAPLL